MIKATKIFLCLLSLTLTFILSNSAFADVNDVHRLVDQGWALENQGRGQEALALYNQAWQINPNDFLVHKHLGIHWAKTGNYWRGIKELNKAVELNPSDASSAYNLGLVYQMAHAYRSALVSYTQAIASNPRYYSAITNRGTVNLILKNYKTAVEDFSNSLVMNPQKGETFMYRGEAYWYLKDMPSAQSDFNQAISLKPSLILKIYVWEVLTKFGKKTISLFFFILFLALYFLLRLGNLKTITANLQTVADILHSEIVKQSVWIKFVEGTYKGKKIILQYFPFDKYNRIYIKTILPMAGQENQKSTFFLLSRPITKFTKLAGNVLIYVNAYPYINWQNKLLSKEEVTLMLDRLVEGADIAESGTTQLKNQTSDMAGLSSSKKSILFQTVIGIGASLCFLYVFLPGFFSTFWPSVNGEILNSSVCSVHHGGYMPCVSYLYSIDHQNYRGNNVTFSMFQERGFFIDDNVQKLVDQKYRPGTNIAVYYDPKHRDWSVLDPGFCWLDYVMLAIMIFFGITMIKGYMYLQKYKKD